MLLQTSPLPQLSPFSNLVLVLATTYSNGEERVFLLLLRRHLAFGYFNFFLSVWCLGNSSKRKRDLSIVFFLGLRFISRVFIISVVGEFRCTYWKLESFPAIEYSTGTYIE